MAANREYEASLAWASFFLGLELWVLFAGWYTWSGRDAQFFRVSIIALLLLQAWTVWHTWYKQRKLNRLLNSLLEDGTDRLEDATRAPGDNSPYKRFRDNPSRLRDLDQIEYQKYLKQKKRGESDDTA